MNSSKTKVMYINKPLNVNLTLKAGSTVIGTADTYKYLGVLADKHCLNKQFCHTLSIVISYTMHAPERTEKMKTL